jgi:hypothetical protein
MITLTILGNFLPDTEFMKGRLQACSASVAAVMFEGKKSNIFKFDHSVQSCFMFQAILFRRQISLVLLFWTMSFIHCHYKKLSHYERYH